MRSCVQGSSAKLPAEGCFAVLTIEYGVPMVTDSTLVASLLALSAIDKDDWEAAMRQILRVDAEILRLGRVSFWRLLRDPPSLRCEIAFTGRRNEYDGGTLIEAADAPTYFSELERATIIAVDDARSDPRTAELQLYLRENDVAALLDVPIWYRGRLAGVLCHENERDPRSWQNSDVDFALAVAQLVAATLEARRRTRAERAAWCSSLLDRASRGLLGEVEPHAIADCALQLVIPAFADWGVVDAVTGGKLERLAFLHGTRPGHALLEELTRRFPPFPEGPHLSARALREGESRLLPELDGDLSDDFGIEPEHARLLRRLGLRSVVVAPLHATEGTVGALVLGSSTRRYDHEDLALAQGLATRIGAALVNARAHAKAQEAIRARDEFISLAAHELHTPLASLQLATESLALRTHNGGGEIQRLTETIVRQVHRLNRLVDHMLDASRVGSRKFAIHTERMDLSRLLRDVSDAFGERFGRLQTRLHCSIENGVVGRWDGTRIAQVVSNLLDNALKFGRSNPVEIALQRDGGDALIIVRDRGIGVPPDRMAMIFEPFERAVPAQSFGGLGLGLFVARAIVEGHGGRIEVESREGSGTTFIVRLPGVERSEEVRA